MNLIKKAPLMAFVLGLGLMVSMITLNSFKADHRFATRYYWYDNDGAGPNVATWHNTSPAPVLGLSCDITQTSTYCSAEFNSAPTTTDNTVATNSSLIVPSTGQLGDLN